MYYTLILFVRAMGRILRYKKISKYNIVKKCVVKNQNNKY